MRANYFCVLQQQNMRQGFDLYIKPFGDFVCCGGFAVVYPLFIVAPILFWSLFCYAVCLLCVRSPEKRGLTALFFIVI